MFMKVFSNRLVQVNAKTETALVDFFFEVVEFWTQNLGNNLKRRQGIFKRRDHNFRCS